MFGVSFTELVVIAGVALLLFGPDELPKIARTAGRFMAEFRKHSDSLRREFYNSVYPPAQEIRRELDQEVRSLRALKHEVLSGPDLSKPSGSQPPAESPASAADASTSSSEPDATAQSSKPAASASDKDSQAPSSPALSSPTLSSPTPSPASVPPTRPFKKD